MRGRHAAAAALMLVAAIGAAHAQSELEQWISQTAEAARTRNYVGTVTYQSGALVETMELVHRHLDGEVRERIFSTSGAPREILRRNDEITCIIPEDRQITIDKFGGDSLFPDFRRVEPERLRAHYRLEDLGERRIAGRQCRGVGILPKDSLRYGYQIWADQQTGVPLKVALVDPDGRVLEQVVFSDVRFPEHIEDALLAPQIDYEGFALYTHRLAPLERGGEPGWRLNSLPPGFALVERQLRRGGEGGDTVEFIELSDGLASVSIYSSRVPPEASLATGPSRMGAVHTWARRIGDHHVTVIGEVPLETVRRIAEGLEPAR